MTFSSLWNSIFFVLDLSCFMVHNELNVYLVNNYGVKIEKLFVAVNTFIQVPTSLILSNDPNVVNQL